MFGRALLKIICSDQPCRQREQKWEGAHGEDQKVQRDKHLVLARWKQRPALPSNAEIRVIETSRKLRGALSKAIRPSFLSKTHQAHMPAHKSIGQVIVV